MRPVAYAVRIAHAAQHEVSDIWAIIRDRIGREDTRQVFKLVRQTEVVDLCSLPATQRWAIGQIARHSALESWAASGYPTAVVDLDTALQLAHTDSPGAPLSAPHGTNVTPLCLGIGQKHCRLVINWLAASSIEIADDASPSPGSLPFDEEGMRRLVTNVGFVLLERPEGLVVRDSQGGLVLPRGPTGPTSITYVIASPRPRRVNLGASSNERWNVDGHGRWGVRSCTRGHWRTQPHGPNGTLRKIIWIAPTWKGPRDAPTSVHSIILGSEVRRR